MAISSTEIQLILNAIDNISGPLQKVKGESDKLGKSFAGARDFASGLGINLTALSNPAMMAGKAIKAVGDYLSDATKETVAYAEQVRDMARVTGMSAQETSRLIQVADDLKVDFGTLKFAARTLARDGITPTVDTLARLADEFVAIKDPQERAAWASKTLGRNWMELSKILEVGGDRLKEMADAQSEALILSQEDLEITRQLEIAKDELNDSNLALQLTIGKKLVPTQVALYDWLNKMLTLDPDTWFQDGADAAADFLKGLGLIPKKGQDAKSALVSISNAVEKQSKLFSLTALAIKDYADGIKDSTVQMLDFNPALLSAGTYMSDLIVQWEQISKMPLVTQEQIDFMLRMNSTIGTHTGTIDDLQDEYKDMALELVKLREQGYWPTSRKVMELTTAMGENKDAQWDARDAIAAATEEMIIQQTMAGLDADAQLELGLSLGIISESEYNIAKTIQAMKGTLDGTKEAQDRYNQAVADLIFYTKDGVLTTQEMEKVFKRLDGQVFTTTYRIITEGQVPSAGDVGLEDGQVPPENIPPDTAPPVPDTDTGRTRPGPKPPQVPRTWGDGGTIINQYISDPVTAAFAASEIQRIRYSRASSLMGA